MHRRDKDPIWCVELLKAILSACLSAVLGILPEVAIAAFKLSIRSRVAQNEMRDKDVSEICIATSVVCGPEERKVLALGTYLAILT